MESEPPFEPVHLSVSGASLLIRLTCMQKEPQGTEGKDLILKKTDLSQPCRPVSLQNNEHSEISEHNVELFKET